MVHLAGFLTVGREGRGGGRRAQLCEIVRINAQRREAQS